MVKESSRVSVLRSFALKSQIWAKQLGQLRRLHQTFVMTSNLLQQVFRPRSCLLPSRKLATNPTVIMTVRVNHSQMWQHGHLEIQDPRKMKSLWLPQSSIWVCKLCTEHDSTTLPSRDEENTLGANIFESQNLPLLLLAWLYSVILCSCINCR